jgi:thioredoxin 1
MVDFGADGCRPCDMMAPILEELKKTYKGNCEIIFVHVREEQVLASRYGISSIPVQVFFDKNGKEVFRHTGFFAKDKIIEQLGKLGVK